MYLQVTRLILQRTQEVVFFLYSVKRFVFFASREQLSEMLAYSDFNMRDIGQEKTAVFMIIHDEKQLIML